MRQRTTGATAVAATLAAAPAMAHAQGSWGDGYGHMMGGGWGLIGLTLMVLFWAAIIVAAVIGVRWLTERDAGSRRADPLDILKERLARGEIDPEEYEARRKALES